jgi:UDP-N-acetyl-D-mannosaminuronic acid dehydrogenase
MTTDNVAIVGAGRIGVPWGAVLAGELGVPVTYIDIDNDRVADLRDGVVPFEEPKLADYLERGINKGLIEATTDPTVVADHRYVAITVNAERNQMAKFLEVVTEYADYLTGDQILINRSTLPIDAVGSMRKAVLSLADGDPGFVLFPERLAEGKAIEEILTLPKVIGVDGAAERTAMDELLSGFDCETLYTDPKTAMFVKLIDNSYRDALFAIANQIAFTADQLGLDAREAISLANREYSRNDIPQPGTVGGKCLPKDPHFLTDERVCDQPTTPDLFGSTRRTNARIPSYVATEVLRRQPSQVTMLGLSYKRGVGDTYNSPAVEIAETLEKQGIEVNAYDPYVSGFDDNLDTKAQDADVVILGVNHADFEGIESDLNQTVPPDAVVYDLWGMLDSDKIQQVYDGFGINTDGDKPRVPQTEFHSK